MLSRSARLLEEIRRDRDRVGATIAAIRKARAEHREVLTGRIRIDGPNGLVVERSDVLTPYVLETVYDDAWRAGPGGAVSIAVEPGTSDADIARLRNRLASIERRGVTVQVARRAEPPRRDA